MADADSHDKENLAETPLAGAGGSFMKPTASSKSRFGAPAAAAGPRPKPARQRASARLASPICVRSAPGSTP